MGFQLVLALVRLAATSVRLMERGQWFNEGQRKQIELEALAVIKALSLKDKTGKQVDAESDQQVLDGLRADGDLRPDERLPQ